MCCNVLSRGVQVSCSGFTPHLGDLLLEVLSSPSPPPLDPSSSGSRSSDVNGDGGGVGVRDDEVLFSNVKEKHIRALKSCK